MQIERNGIRCECFSSPGRCDLLQETRLVFSRISQCREAGRISQENQPAFPANIRLNRSTICDMYTHRFKWAFDGKHLQTFPCSSFIWKHKHSRARRRRENENEKIQFNANQFCFNFVFLFSPCVRHIKESPSLEVRDSSCWSLGDFVRQFTGCLTTLQLKRESH